MGFPTPRVYKLVWICYASIFGFIHSRGAKLPREACIFLPFLQTLDTKQAAIQQEKGEALYFKTGNRMTTGAHKTKKRQAWKPPDAGPLVLASSWDEAAAVGSRKPPLSYLTPQSCLPKWDAEASLEPTVQLTSTFPPIRSEQHC